MLRLLLPFCFSLTGIYAQDSLNEIISKKPVPATWDQILIFKKEWKFQSVIVVKRNKIKQTNYANQNQFLVFSDKVAQIHPVADSIEKMKIEYLVDQRFFLLTDFVVGRYGYIRNLSYRVYALDSSYLVVEPVEYFDFLKQANYRRDNADTTVKTPIIYGRQINIRLPFSGKRILWVYRAVN